MNVSRDEAAQALAEIGDARERAVRVQSYSDAAPFFILWGVIWLVANTVTDFWPQWSGWTWLAGIAIGASVTTWLGILQGRRRAARIHQRGREAGQAAKRVSARFGMSWGVVLTFFVAMGFVIGPLDDRQLNAAISLLWAFVYLGAGVWLGWRLSLIGAVTAAAILFAYFALDQHYYLVMGLAAGGGLIIGGLWLRKV
jgi:hypothetical protein